jgi:hypothetical protein
LFPMHAMPLVLLSELFIPFISFLCMKILVFYFVPHRILSFDFNACHVSFFFSQSFLNSLYFMCVHDNYVTILSSL